jgi:predicted enzyme related to lactoylglutathione lyase
MKMNLIFLKAILVSLCLVPNKNALENQGISKQNGSLISAKTINTSATSLWHDLVTPDLAASKDFYGKIFQWTFQDENFKGISYTTIYHNEKVIGGMIEMKSAKSSTWISSLPLSNQDLNKRIKKLVGNGAKPLLAPVKIPGRGKQVVFEGSQGEEFALISANQYTDAMDTETSEGNWLGIEFWASDVKKAEDFYKNAFEVEIQKTMYDNKAYWLFVAGGNTLAGMIQNPVTNQGSQWVPYVRMGDLESIVSKVKQASGSVILAPNMKVREGKISIIQDPHGAIIAIQKQ